MTIRSILRRLLPWHLVPKNRATFARDGLWTIHNADFLSDARFREAYAAGRATGSWGGADIEWRAHVALWAASQALGVAGDFIEFGVNRGGLSRALVEYLDWTRTGRRLFLLDTFAGFASEHPPAHRKEWGYEDSHQAVCQSFAGFPGVRIIKGAVPGTLDAVPADTIAYAHVDMNCVEPERAALDWLWPRLPVGGVVLLDDYGWSGHAEQKAAHDRFAHDHGQLILSLPTGQGLMIRRP